MWNIDIITCARPLCEMSSKISHKVDKSILNKFWQLAECNQTKIIQASKGLIEDLSLRQVDEVRYIHVQLMVKFWNYSVFWDQPQPPFGGLTLWWLNIWMLYTFSNYQVGLIFVRFSEEKRDKYNVNKTEFSFKIYIFLFVF